LESVTVALICQMIAVHQKPSRAALTEVPLPRAT
jgi:hypothetical protein